MNYDNAYAGFMSIYLNNFNKDQKIDEQSVCVEIAHFMNMLHVPTKHTEAWRALWDFIREFGEEIDETYLGRDAEGEKVYHTRNKETNWHERIRKELVKLGYYKRWQEANEIMETV